MAAKEEILRQKLKTSEFKSLKIEKELIAGILKYKEVLRRCIKQMSPEVFSSDKCKWIYNTIREFYDAENLILNTDALKIQLENKPEIERVPYVQLWNSILKLKGKIKLVSCIASISKLERLQHARFLEYGMANTLNFLKKALKNEGDNFIEEAKKHYLEIVPRLETKHVITSVSEPISHYEEFKRLHIKIQKDPSLMNSIPTGLEELDNMFGGLRPSEFGLITAGTGVGKSIMMHDFAYHCYIGYGDSLYVTIEMPSAQLRERFYCRASGIQYENFRNYKLTPEHWEKLDRKIKKLGEHDHTFHMLDIPQSCTVDVLRMEIEEHIQKHGEPKLICIDYLNIIRGGFEWSKQLEIAVDVKQQIARYFKIATWSANQLMGSKHDKQDIKISDMGFAKNIADNVDIGLGLGITDLTEDEEIFNITFTKTRDFKGKSFTIQGDRSRMTFTKTVEAKKKKSLNFKDKSQIGQVEI